MVWVAISFFSGTAKLQWGLALHIRGPDVAEDEGPGEAPAGCGELWLDTRNRLAPALGSLLLLAGPRAWSPSWLSFDTQVIFIKGLWSIKIKGKTAAPGRVFLCFLCQSGSCQNGLPALATCEEADGWGLRATGGLGVCSHPWLCH